MQNKFSMLGWQAGFVWRKLTYHAGQATGAEETRTTWPAVQCSWWNRFVRWLINQRHASPARLAPKSPWVSIAVLTYPGDATTARTSQAFDVHLHFSFIAQHPGHVPCTDKPFYGVIMVRFPKVSNVESSTLILSPVTTLQYPIKERWGSFNWNKIGSTRQRHLLFI